MMFTSQMLPIGDSAGVTATVTDGQAVIGRLGCIGFTPVNLDEYCGVRVGDALPLADSSNFGAHWQDRLGDTFEVLEMWWSPAGRAEDSIGAEQVLVRVRSEQQPGFHATIGMDSLLSV